MPINYFNFPSFFWKEKDYFSNIKKIIRFLYDENLLQEEVLKLNYSEDIKKDILLKSISKQERYLVKVHKLILKYYNNINIESRHGIFIRQILIFKNEFIDIIVKKLNILNRKLNLLNSQKFSWEQYNKFEEEELYLNEDFIAIVFGKEKFLNNIFKSTDEKKRKQIIYSLFKPIVITILFIETFNINSDIREEKILKLSEKLNLGGFFTKNNVDKERIFDSIYNLGNIKDVEF